MSSAYRAHEDDGGTWSHHNGQIYRNSKTAAVDFVTYSRPGTAQLGLHGRDSAKMRDLAKWLYEHFGDLTVEMFHTTPFNTDNGFNIRYQEPTHGIPGHDNHIHFATSEALLGKMESRAPQLFREPVPHNVVVEPVVGASTLFGWDTSDYDHDRGMRPSHVRAAAEEGIRFFTHKVTDGTKTIHNRAGGKLKAARDAGIPFLGAYAVPRTPGNNGHGGIIHQVEFAIAETTRQFPDWQDFPGWFWQVDLEHWDWDTVQPWCGVEMCKQLRELTGKTALLYAPHWSYGDSIAGADPLWASDYGPNRIGNFKDLYDARDGNTGRGWRKYSDRTPVIWQFGSRGIVGGQKTCDINAFRGTEDDFARMINAPAVV
ncbi:hypothetical protein [Catellatospora tritici]|uniref:hypothetical protein n=1 Tax=Catellatospora tritici TaxID=2851566 RepID=UPI001C2DBF7C|nr:hypothetical protein [Catellatospora tritici]MBV1853379.1 hypothetical protein [Catellatospora tritici]